MDKKNSREYQFLNEETKKVPKNWKKFIHKIIAATVLAVVFGVVASLVFVGLKPALEKKFSGKSDQTKDLSLSENTAEEETQDQTETAPTGQELVDTYESVQTQLYTIGKNAGHSIVEIRSISSQKDWFQTDYETEGEGSGVIIGKNDREILILTERSLIRDAGKIQVAFSGGDQTAASIKAYDGATDLAVLSVSVKDVKDGTKMVAEPVTFSSKATMQPGSSVIAVGSPLGEARSVQTGSITLTDRKTTVIDANYHLYTTDMPASASARGILLNKNGEMIGLLHQSGDCKMLEAISITELSDLIQQMMNGNSPVYLGLQISEVTSSIASEYDLPKGLYIKNVQLDSPAVTAGLQAGDIIVEMSGKTVTSEAQYEEILKKGKSGQRVAITVKRQGSDDTYQDVYCKAELKSWE